MAAHFFSWQHATTPVLPAISSLLRQVRDLRNEIVVGEEAPQTLLIARKSLYAALSELPQTPSPLVLLIDGLDEADEHFEPVFPLPLPEGLRVVLSVRSDEGAGPPWLFRWMKSAQTHTLEPLDASAVRAWADSVRGQERSARPVGDNLAQEIWRRTHGYPLYLHYLMPDVAVAVTSKGNLNALLDEIPTGFRAYIDQEFVRLAEGVILSAVLSP